MKYKEGDYIVYKDTMRPYDFAKLIVKVEEKHLIVEMGYKKYIPLDIADKYWKKMPGYFKSPLWIALEGKK